MAKEKSEGKGKMKMIALIGGAVVLLAGVGAGAYMLGAKSAPAGASGHEFPAEEVAVLDPSEKTLGPTVVLDEFIANLMDDEETRYLKAGIALETTNEAAATELQQRMPQVRDAILLLVSSRTYNELRDLQGKLQLRAEVVARLNGFLRTGKVKKVYFTDFVIQ